MRKTVFFLLWCVFLFVLLEAAGFVFYKLEVSKPVSGYGYPAGLIVAHPDLGYLYQPGFAGYFKGSAYQDIPIEINANGFRDDAFENGAPGDRRVAVLGDSVVFGSGVRKEDRFTECLDTSRHAPPGGRRILNLGVNSYSFGHYLALAELDFLGARPDAVLVGITLNDFAAMDSGGPAARLRRYEGQLHKPLWFERIQERIGRTYAVRFVRELQTRFSYAMMNADEREEYHTKWMRTVVDGWGMEDNRLRFEGELDSFRKRVDGAGIPYGFILFPELNDLQDPAEFGSARTRVKQILDERGLRYCDPYDTFARTAHPASLFLQRDSIHYNRDGHRLICEVLDRCMRDGIIPPGPAE